MVEVVKVEVEVEVLEVLEVETGVVARTSSSVTSSPSFLRKVESHSASTSGQYPASAASASSSFTKGRSASARRRRPHSPIAGCAEYRYLEW